MSFLIKASDFNLLLSKLCVCGVPFANVRQLVTWALGRSKKCVSDLYTKVVPSCPDNESPMSEPPFFSSLSGSHSDAVVTNQSAAMDENVFLAIGNEESVQHDNVELLLIKPLRLPRLTSTLTQVSEQLQAKISKVSRKNFNKFLRLRKYLTD